MRTKNLSWMRCLLWAAVVIPILFQGQRGATVENHTTHDETEPKSEQLQRLVATISRLESFLQNVERIGHHPAEQRTAATAAREKIYPTAEYLKDVQECINILEK